MTVPAPTTPLHKITYEADGQTYKVELRFRSASVLKAALKHDDVRGKEGEELVAAIKAFAKGNLFRIDRYKNDKRNDSLASEAAVEIFDPEGKPQAKLRYQDDIANDGVKGEAALWQVKEGRVFTQRYKNGLLNDGAKGEPAVRGYNADGTHVIDKRYKDGELQDSADGRPAVHIRINGTGHILLTAHYAAGVACDGADGSPALVRYSADGLYLQEVRRIKDGLLNDSADGKPALTLFDAKGKTAEIAHMQKGKLQDTKAKPARTRFRADGFTPRFVEYFTAGVANDGPKGEPARQKFSPATGELLTVARLTMGVRNDGPNGEPALVNYLRGAITRLEHRKDGELHDAANGEPAVSKFAFDSDDATSTLTETVRFAMGLKTDGADGAPAVEKFDGFGNLAAIEHFLKGAPCNAPDGKPAMQHFMDGKTNRASRLTAAGILQPLTEKELAILNGETPKATAKQRLGRILRFGK